MNRDISNSLSDTRRLKLDSLAIDRSAGAPRAASARHFGWLTITVVAVVTAMGSAALWWHWSPAPAPWPAAAGRISESPAAPPPTPQIAPVVASEWIAAGYFVARRQAIVGSEVTAKVRNVFVTDGDHVVAGQRIADLEDALAKAELAVARARAQAAAGATEALLADLAEAEKALKRLSLLSDRGHAAEVDVDRIRARVAILRAQGEEAKAKQIAAIAEVQRAEAILAQYAIVAPFAGVITGCTAQPGEIISSTSSGSGYIRTGVCTIVDLASIEIEVDVNETQIARVSPATIATATPDAFPALNLKARIRTIVPSASREKSTVKVRLTLEDRDPRILPDMAVKVAFSATQAEAPFHSQPAGRITHE